MILYLHNLWCLISFKSKDPCKEWCYSIKRYVSKDKTNMLKPLCFFLVSCFGVSPDMNDRGRGRVAGGSVQATRSLTRAFEKKSIVSFPVKI